MGKPALKPRWEPWENTCVQIAFKQKIQHKVMAVALGRTVSSVSKKISTLGLRSPSSLRGKVKGQSSFLTKKGKTPLDLARMTEILKVYAPLRCFQEGHLALQKGCWTQSPSTVWDNPGKEAYLDPIHYHDFPFSFVKPLDFVPSDEALSQEIDSKRVPGDPAYVPLYYLDQWAVSEGFHKIKGALQEKGLSYWKEGTYFSQTQLLMHVNRLRFKHNLQPIALAEEE
ncbi:MAG: hypothetical protein H0X26_07060 [Alphaproteobacteria bacterium]|nr:hypothetical protein [Alphaproteobacteria bacterium]